MASAPSTSTDNTCHSRPPPTDRIMQIITGIEVNSQARLISRSCGNIAQVPKARGQYSHNFSYPSFLELRNWGGNVSKQLAKVATQWNSGTTRESNPGPRARIPSVLTTEPLSHYTLPTDRQRPWNKCVKSQYQRSIENNVTLSVSQSAVMELCTSMTTILNHILYYINVQNSSLYTSDC